MCPYAQFKKDENFENEIIFCKKQKDVCPFTRYCIKEKKVIPNDRIGYTMEDCKLRKEIDIPDGSSKVRKEISDFDFLYIDIKIGKDLYTYKLKNPYNEIPDYVYVKETISGAYEIVGKNIKGKTLKI